MFLLDAAAPAGLDAIRSGSGAVIAVCVAGLAALAAVIVLLHIRRKRKNGQNDTESGEEK